MVGTEHVRAIRFHSCCGPTLMSSYLYFYMPVTELVGARMHRHDTVALDEIPLPAWPVNGLASVLASGAYHSATNDSPSDMTKFVSSADHSQPMSCITSVFGVRCITASCIGMLTSDDHAAPSLR